MRGWRKGLSRERERERERETCLRAKRATYRAANARATTASRRSTYVSSISRQHGARLPPVRVTREIKRKKFTRFLRGGRGSGGDDDFLPTGYDVAITSTRRASTGRHHSRRYRIVRPFAVSSGYVIFASGFDCISTTIWMPERS